VTDPAKLRASDADRERTVVELRRHAADGRLTVDELAERSARAYGAKTVGELGWLLVDLPEPAAPLPPPEPRAARGYGVRPFLFQWERAAQPADALRYIAPVLQRFGYELVERTGRRLAFDYSYRPLWTFAVAVLLFPLGLVALAYKAHERVRLDFDEASGGGTRLVLSGRAPRRVRRALAELAV
jgi:Domain of unknown function (DUF1707)